MPLSLFELYATDALFKLEIFSFLSFFPFFSALLRKIQFTRLSSFKSPQKREKTS